MTHLHPVARLRMSGVIPLFPLWAFVVCARTVYGIILLLLSTLAQNKRITLNVSPTLTAVTMDKYKVKSIDIQWSKRVYRRGSCPKAISPILYGNHEFVYSAIILVTKTVITTLW